MSGLVGNPEGKFSQDEAQLIFLFSGLSIKENVFLKGYSRVITETIVIKYNEG